MEIVDILVIDSQGRGLTRPKDAASLMEYLRKAGWETFDSESLNGMPPLVSDYTWIAYRDDDGYRQVAAVMLEGDETLPTSSSLWPEEEGFPPALVLAAEEVAEAALNSYLTAFQDWKTATRRTDEDGALLETLIERAGYMQDAATALTLADRLCRGFYGERMPPELKAWREALRSIDNVLDEGGEPYAETEAFFGKSDKLAKWAETRWPQS